MKLIYPAVQLSYFGKKQVMLSPSKLKFLSPAQKHRIKISSP